MKDKPPFFGQYFWNYENICLEIMLSIYFLKCFCGDEDWNTINLEVPKPTMYKPHGIFVGVAGRTQIDHVILEFKKQINGFLGIGSAPEFLENLMWKKFTKKMKSETIKNGILQLKHGNYEYPITLQLIKDGRKNKVLNKRINSKINVTMVHGRKDEVVPVSYSRKVLKIFQKAKKKLLIIKDGDHSLSSQKWLKIIIKELKMIV